MTEKFPSLSWVEKPDVIKMSMILKSTSKLKEIRTNGVNVGQVQYEMLKRKSNLESRRWSGLDM